MRTALDDLKLAFSQVPPTTIWQELLDTDPKVVKRLCGYSSKLAREDDLYSYLSHLRFSREIQVDLFQFLLPSCLEEWQNELASKSGTTNFTGTFHATLSSCRALEVLLSPHLREAVLTFMRKSLLDRLDFERDLLFIGTMEGDSVYHWFRCFAVYGVLALDIERLWHEWWSMKTTGHAVAALQYASCLMYPEAENPVFAAWTPTEGGGPPSLWEYESLDYDSSWREENLEFLQRCLTVDYLREKVELAAQRLESESAYKQAERIRNDFSTWSWLVESRVMELPQHLATPNLVTPIGWTL